MLLLTYIQSLVYFSMMFSLNVKIKMSLVKFDYSLYNCFFIYLMCCTLLDSLAVR